MNIHEIVDRLEAWVNRGTEKNGRSYSIDTHKGYLHRSIFLHPGRTSLCVLINETSSILRLI